MQWLSTDSPKLGMGTDFEKKTSNLCGDTADFTPPPPYLVQDFMQSPVIDIIYVHIQSPALAAKKKKKKKKKKNSASNSHS